MNENKKNKSQNIAKCKFYSKEIQKGVKLKLRGIVRNSKGKEFPGKQKK